MKKSAEREILRKLELTEEEVLKVVQFVERLRSGVKDGNGSLRPDSKMGKIREAFKLQDNWTLMELMALTAFDQANCMCAMSILQNPKRTPKERLLVTDYDKATRTYRLHTSIPA